jgi:diguanylate cyclase (GGDEF)-like protein
VGASSLSTRRGLTRTTGIFYVAAGLLVLLACATEGVEGHRMRVVLAIGVIACVGGPALLSFGRSLPRDVFHVLVVVGTGINTAVVALIGGGPFSLAAASLYLFGIVIVAFFFSWVGMVLQVALMVACAVTALHHVGLTAGPIVVVIGAMLVVGGVVAWLARIAHAVEEDPLTLLPNRRGLDWRLEEALEGNGRDHYQLSLILLGIDQFKRINADHGHRGGDRVLSQCAHQWRRHLASHQVLCRFGGDVFAVLLPGMGLGRAADLADELRAASPEMVTVSSGVATWVPGDSPSMLVSRADVALFEAKSMGRDQTVVFGDRERGASELEAAIDDGEMVLHFQPIVRLADRSPVSCESLVRWNHPRKGLIGPGEFVQQAEYTGAIHSLGAWTLDEACRVAAANPESPALQVVSVNVSVPELRSRSYVPQLRETLERHQLAPDRLTIEVTEAVFDGRDPQLVASLGQIRELGVRVAIDDFGSGYSSLRWIDSLPLDTMKIDAAFVWAIPEDSDEAPVLEAIIRLGRSLGKRIVAEGVETEHQAAVLARLGCEYAQGYLFARPAALDVSVRPVAARS